MQTISNIFSRVQKLRDASAMTCEDMVLNGGTIIYTKEQGVAQVALYDELLEALKRQGGMVEVEASDSDDFLPPGLQEGGAWLQVIRDEIHKAISRSLVSQ